MPAQYELASEQLPLVNTITESKITVSAKGDLKENHDANSVSFTSSEATIKFDRKSGLINAFVVKGQSFLEMGTSPKPNFWRAPTDNDYGAGFGKKLAVWKSVFDSVRLDRFKFDLKENVGIAEAEYTLLKLNAKLLLRYTLNAKGELLVGQEMIAEGDSSNIEMLPRFGMQWILPAGFDLLEYYGKGPFENYQDRDFGANVGLYRQTVDQQFFPYVTPQETGNKTGVRWMKIFNEQGKGLLLKSSVPLSVSALHYFDADLDDGPVRLERHAADLTKRRQTQWNIDFAQMGVGGIDSWGAKPLPKYTLPFKSYTYSYLISPF